MSDDISTEWTGHELVDVNGEKIGTVEDVRFGDATGGLKWLVVKTGLFGGKKVLVPAEDLRATEDKLVAPYLKERVKDAPAVDEDQTFTLDQERHICAYYGLDYVSKFGSPDEGCEPHGDGAAAASAEEPSKASQPVRSTLGSPLPQSV
jgi:sporulation protein YlmC with PRC-barrel domain